MNEFVSFWIGTGKELQPMKIVVSQIYIEAGVTYPFSHIFQKWLSDELTKRVQPSPAFVGVYSEVSKLICRMSAKSTITEPSIRGPTVFKRVKDVEFTIFLPHDGHPPKGLDDLRRPLKLLLESIVAVLQSLGLDASQVVKDSPDLIEHIISNPAMISVT